MALRIQADASRCSALVVSSHPCSLQGTWEGVGVADGDARDLRHLDPKGVVVGLLLERPKARRLRLRWPAPPYLTMYAAESRDLGHDRHRFRNRRPATRPNR